MLSTKLVVRLLDPQDHLLGWTEVMADARGDGKLWVKESAAVVVERAGTMAYVSVHWCDVNVEIRNPSERVSVTVGQFFRLPSEWEAIIVGPIAKGLPPTTTKGDVMLAVPVGALGAKGHA